MYITHRLRVTSFAYIIYRGDVLRGAFSTEKQFAYYNIIRIIYYTTYLYVM